MAIDTTGLFTTIGRIGKLLYLADPHAAALPAALSGLFDEYTGYSERLITPAAITAAATAPRVPASYLGPYQQLAANTLLWFVRQDAPASAGSIAAALVELRRQMIAGSVTVKRSTIGATPTAVSPVGTGSVVTTTLRPDGLRAELAIAETAAVIVTSDTYTGTATSGLEQVSWVGADTSQGGGLGDYLYYAWPSGSTTTAFNAIDSTTGPSASGNLLTNGDLETWTVTNVPDGWTVDVGSANFTQSTSQHYMGASSGNVAGGVAEVRISNTLAFGLLQPFTSYAVVVRSRISTVPAAGDLTIELTDSTGTVLTDYQSTNNSTTISLTSAPNNTWVTQTAVFRTGPSVPVLGGKLRIRALSLSSGSSLQIDSCVLTPMVYPYSGSIGVAVIGGATPWAIGDKTTVAVTNDRGGASYNATFQALFERLFGMSQYGIVLPSASSPSLADTLITS